MGKSNSPQLMDLPNEALARELKVSVQYMMQHGIEAGRKEAGVQKLSTDEQCNFVATHWHYFLPGISLKKIAITEMRHAEAITERIVLLGGDPVTQPSNIKISAIAKTMLEDDLEEEREAIELYNRIIEKARAERDDLTVKLFKFILSDEENHFKTFSRLLTS